MLIRTTRVASAACRATLVVMGRTTARRPVLRLGHREAVARPDTLVVEEPLEIRVGGRPLAVTMRTPGSDMELAAGFLVSEGVVSEAGHVRSQRYCGGATVRDGLMQDDDLPDGDLSDGDPSDGALLGRPAASNTYNVLDVVLHPDVPPPDPGLERAFYTTSSCGVCGKASLDAVRTVARWPVADDPVRVPAELLAGLPDRLREAQRVFEKTGGLHAAALFTGEGDLLVVREDVGRHNAVDKVVGWALQQGRLPLHGTVLLVSGRASFELAQKAWMAGIPVLAAVSAPSSLAVDLAVEAGMTLVGFLRGPTMNVYSRPDRVA